MARLDTPQIIRAVTSPTASSICAVDCVNPTALPTAPRTGVSSNWLSASIDLPSAATFGSQHPFAPRGQARRVIDQRRGVD